MSKETIEKIANKIWEYGGLYQSETEQLAKYIYQDFIEPLEKKNKVIERALELACKGVELKYAKPFGNKADYKPYFIQQAEEELL